MKTFISLLLALGCLPLFADSVPDQPRGSVLELHSCELYAGGCVISSEATLGGRYMLQAWNFTGGTFQGSSLAGLQVAVLHSGSQNLAESQAATADMVVYLPDKASKAQRTALIAWVKSNQKGAAAAHIKIRVVPMTVGRDETGYSFSAGKFISVKTASLESCEKGSCGESLWYAPRALTSLYTVAVNKASHVKEPLLQLKWDEGGDRSVFLGRFGEQKNENLFVTAADLCGPTEKLF